MSAETDREVCFVDSNVWLYILLPGQDSGKASAARDLVRRNDLAIHISTQVVSEVAYGVIRHAVMDESEIRETIRRLYARYAVEPITEATQLRASELREVYALSYWDSLIVAAALQSGAKSLYSEDMQNGLLVDERPTIVNPLLIPG